MIIAGIIACTAIVFGMTLSGMVASIGWKATACYWVFTLTFAALWAVAFASQ